MSNPQSLCNYVHCQTADENGILKFERYVTAHEMHNNFKAFLKGEKLEHEDSDAYYEAEWVSFNITLENGMPLKDGHMVALVCPGGNEGMHLNLLWNCNGGIYQTISTAKYFCDPKLLWALAQKVNDAAIG